ncbi:MAG: gamma-glutamyl-gamma-aminobutyrate hydrolase family protein, partial [Promethearchaeota archaeon]
IILQRLEMMARPPEGMAAWKAVVNQFMNPTTQLRIAMPGKYVAMADTYVSINEALRSAGAHQGAGVTIDMVDAEMLGSTDDAKEKLLIYDGILLTPGFGTRGTEGMIRSAWIAVEEDLPFLGICFGAQLLFVALCRYALGMKKANSTELDPKTPYPVVDLLPEQREIEEKGGTMRLAGHPVYIKASTKLRSIYKKTQVRERFRHRYHLMWDPAKKAEDVGLVISATDKTGHIINAIELSNKYWMVGVQYHPEYTSRPDQPHPLYNSFIEAMLKRKLSKGQGQ